MMRAMIRRLLSRLAERRALAAQRRREAEAELRLAEVYRGTATMLRREAGLPSNSEARALYYSLLVIHFEELAAAHQARAGGDHEMAAEHLVEAQHYAVRALRVAGSIPAPEAVHA